MSRKTLQPALYAARSWLVLSLILVSLIGLAVRAAWLQVVHNEPLKKAGQARYVRDVQMNAKRGMILDRHGEPLAVSSPVDSIWAHPGELLTAKAKWQQLADVLGIDAKRLAKAVAQNQKREFMYLKRHLTPAQAKRVHALALPGVYSIREYRRFYPMAELTSHVVGVTDIDDRGQEGMELKMNKILAGEHGLKRVIRDRRGNIVEDFESIRRVEDGKDVVLSIDTRIQYEAMRNLDAAIEQHEAIAGSVVVIDVVTGEILAMVNAPYFNPNVRGDSKASDRRNRTVTDVFDPGSTLKPFTVALAMQKGLYGANTVIDTEPGTMRVGRLTVRDIRDYGDLTVSDVIAKSSNVGVVKMALSMESNAMVEFLDQLGIGRSTHSGLPGEVGGLLDVARVWKPIERATLAYGYGTSITPLQLARLYATLARGGELIPLTIERRDGRVAGSRVISTEVARQVTAMLEQVTAEDGTGTLAAVPLYRVAGKTGTAKKLVDGGYKSKTYRSLFAGFAPASKPRLAIAVMIDEPRGKDYYGGLVAAPVFGAVMGAALRLLNVAPDASSVELTTALVQHAGNDK